MTSLLGYKIRSLRGKQTLDALAKRAGMSKSYLWSLERGNPVRPSAEKIAQLAKALEVEIDYLLDDKEQITELDAKDMKFYRYYCNLAPETRQKIRSIARIIGGDEYRT